MSEHAVLRRHMVDSQLLPNNLRDERVVDALSAVPREAFVPKALKGVAYIDEDLQIAPGRFLMEPRVFARLLEGADITGDDVILDLGCATGYSTAVLARLGATVVALEEDAGLADQASEALAELSIDNCAVINGPLAEGRQKEGPFDVIICGGAVADIPAALTDQLADGGRLVAVRRTGSMGKAVVISRDGDAFAERELFDAAVPFLPGFAPDSGFRF